MSFAEKYTLEKDLGKGAFSQVKLAVEKENGTRVAVKIVTRERMAPNDEKSLAQELEILALLKGGHPGVVSLLGKYDDPEFHYIVLELMAGGELFQRIVQREKYTEGDAREVVRVMASVLSYIHAKDIVHRDLKPENILLQDDSDHSKIKFADFGFARFVKEGCRTACGSPGYVAPEVISGKIYNSQCDNWSLGVLLYILLSGYPPFYAKERKEMFRQIKQAKFKFDSPYWDNVSPEAKDLVKRLFVVDPEARLTADQILAHDWIRASSPSEVNLLEENGKHLGLFNARRRFRTGFHKVIKQGKVNELVTWVKRKSTLSSH